MSVDNLPRVKARNLLKYDTEVLWDKLAGNFILVMDDGEIVTNHKETIYSHYVWEFHRKYPQTPLLTKHHASALLKKNRYGCNTDTNLINSVFWSVYDACVSEDRTKLLDDLAKTAYEVINTIYNAMIEKLERYVTSLDIVDLIRIIKDPEIAKSLNEVTPTQESIDEVYSLLNEKFKNDPVIYNNPAVKAINSGIVKKNQALQCLGPRGFVTDVDSHIFDNPILRGFTQGIRSAHDMIVETRSASKALIFSEDPLQKSEYFSRRQQLIWQNVRNLHLGDCGSKEYHEWKVRDERYEGITKIADCDLKTIEGKYYLDEETNTLKVVRRTDTHLIGKTIKLRSIIAGCKHPDPYGVCEVCYGEAALAVPENSNLGHISGVAMTSKLGQSILSIKHHDASSVVEGIVLKPYEKKYLSSPINGSIYYLAKGLQNKKVTLVVKGYQDKTAMNANGLSDINLTDKLEKLSLSRVTEFAEIGLIVTSPKDEESVTLNVEVAGRLPSFTYEMLRYVKEKGWSVNAKNDYLIDMSDWDFSNPILILPLRHFNTSNHQTEIASILESTVSELEKRCKVINPMSLIVDLHDVVNRRLSVSLSILEIVLYSSMGIDPMSSNYDLPKAYTTSGVGILSEVMFKRSLSAAMAYQGHLNVFTRPNSFTLKNRMNHLFDPLILPELLNDKSNPFN